MTSPNNFTSRVTQLDSLILDQEFYNFVKNQLIKIFDKFKLSNWVQIYEPEFDLIVSSIIWKLTIGVQRCTIGQRLLGLRYPEEGCRLRLYYFFSVICPYLNSKIGSYLAKRESPILNLDFQSLNYTKRIDTLWKMGQIINFCIFLRGNKYVSLSHRFSRLRIIPSHQRLPFPPGDSYQIRELLWHQFSDFLMIVVPFVNLHIFKRYWSAVQNYWSNNKQGSSPDTESSSKRLDVVAKCCFCSQDAVIPQHVGNCSFCYYCLKANQIVDKNFKCANCSH